MILQLKRCTKINTLLVTHFGHSYPGCTEESQQAVLYGTHFQNISPDPQEDRQQGKPVRNCLLCFFQEGRRREGEEEREREETKTTWERKVKEDGGPEGQLGP